MITATGDGTIRRMPNIVKFREDPDAMLVMALEEYDEVTGEAKKAPILLKDGARLFHNLGYAAPKLEQVDAVGTPGATHIRYVQWG